MSRKHKALLATSIVVAVLVIDQLIKVWVKTHMFIGESIHVTDWFQLHFIENNGMAFGWELGGKYFLTAFRLIVVTGIGWYTWRRICEDTSTFLIVCLALIIAGAAGNIIDCLFYGLIFNNPAPPQVAQFVPWGMGYSSLMLGRVVDMFYFPLVEWDMPMSWTWLNSISFLPDAGEHCIFFSPIFNFADAAISCSIIALLISYAFRIRKP